MERRAAAMVLLLAIAGACRRDGERVRPGRTPKEGGPYRVELAAGEAFDMCRSGEIVCPAKIPICDDPRSPCPSICPAGWDSGGIARNDALLRGLRHRAAPRVPDHGALTRMAVDPMGQERRNRIWLKLLLLAVLRRRAGGAAVLDGVDRFFFDRARLTRFLESLGMWSFAGFIFLQVVQVIAAPIPGEVTGFLGGFLYGPFLGILLNTIGLTVGSVIAFQLSRTFGRPAVDRLVDPEDHWPLRLPPPPQGGVPGVPPVPPARVSRRITSATSSGWATSPCSSSS